MDRILQILAELRPDVDFTLAQNLIDDGVLDSFDVVSLVSELCDAFEVSIMRLLQEGEDLPGMP